ncbi:hypothetical protein [Nocardioides mesophilus]|uniref:DUF2613 family protein n=1 Tax=Nocardioides mesophilus TaxID=433659 RepID=A0A7G9RBR0_9ACTN|nr:hypothetical protein [Nocardioides mesophilus]QNN53035.1 hypothetical protein H9L09_00560 [Nocardioides mesophilus]
MMGSSIVGVIVAAVAGAVVSLVATFGLVATVSAPPDVADQAAIVQYADA